MVAAARPESPSPMQRDFHSHRSDRRDSLRVGWLGVATLVFALTTSATGCMHDQHPAQLRGEITGKKSLYFVRECRTGRLFELRLNEHAEVLLTRRVDKVHHESNGPVLVELGGKSLPATTSTRADAVFDVRAQYSVRAGSCD
jgi:hypothetical protein